MMFPSHDRGGQEHPATVIDAEAVEDTTAIGSS